jgi:nucleoid-associated protein YejK
MPAASIALDLFLGSQPDPMLEEISNKIDALATKIDINQQETMQAFKGLEASVCESALSQSRSTLEGLNKFMGRTGGKNIVLYNAYSVCGPYFSLCTQALTTITEGLPKCLDKIIDASVFSGGR